LRPVSKSVNGHGIRQISTSTRSIIEPILDNHLNHDKIITGFDVPTLSTMAIAMGWHKPDNVAGSSAPAIMVGLFVATGGILFGYDTG